MQDGSNQQIVVFNLRLGVWVCVNINATWCANIQAKERNKNIQVYIVWYLLEEYWLGTQGIVVSFT